MSMSWREWHAEGERAAARSYGESHRGLFMAWRFAPVAGVAVGLGALGLFGWWAYHRAAGLLSGSGPSFSAHIPFGFWIALAVVILATMIAFRPGSIPISPATSIAKVVVIVFAWIFLAAWTVGILA